MLIAKILLLAVNLATGILVARTLAPAGRGELAAIILWPTLLVGLFTLGVPYALTYNSRRSPDRQAEFLSVALILGAGLGVLAAIVGAIAIPHMLPRYDRTVVTFAQWAMLVAPFAMIAYVLQCALEARSDFTTSNLSKTLPQIASLAVLGCLFVLGRMTPFSSAYAYMAPPVVVPIVLFWRLRRAISTKIEHFRAAAKDLISYGMRLYAIDVLTTLSTQVDQVLVVGLLSAEGLGLYVVALNASRVLGVLHSSLVTVLFPKAASLEDAEVELLIGRAVRLGTLAAALAAAALIPIIPFLMVRLYGVAFARVSAVAQILCVEMVVTGATSILAQAFTATGRAGTVAVLQVIGLGLTVPFMLLLIPRFGLAGAAGALLLSSTCRLCMTAACYPTILKWKVPNLLVTSEDLTYLRERLRRVA